MKINFIIILLVGVVFSACDDSFLDRYPLDVFSDSSLWSSVSDAEAALNGCYNNWEDGHRVIYMDVASDNEYNQFPWRNYTQLGNMQLLTPTNTGAHRWSFTTIQRCNWFLENIDKVSMDDSLRKQMKGEARFLRAYRYFIAQQLYGDFPLVTETLTPEQANLTTRDDKQVIVDFVINELNEIAQDLPLRYPQENGRITRGAALGLKSRIELYQKDYESCIKSSQAIISSGVYDLFPDYAGVFRIQNEHNEEVILNVEYLENEFPFDGIKEFPSTFYGGGVASTSPTQSLVDAYEMDNGKTIDDPTSGYDPDQPYKNRDPRLAYSIVTPGSLYNGYRYGSIDETSPDYYAGNNNSKTGYLVRKFVPDISDFPDYYNTGLNMIVMRYAEILLNFAEAKIELGQLDNSMYAAINEVRERAGMPAVDESIYNNQSSLQELVRRERRVELAMEGLRWFDIQRWRIGDEVMNGTVYGARLGTVDPNTGEISLGTERIVVEERAFDPDKNYLWPVPQNVIDVNPNISQNPGY